MLLFLFQYFEKAAENVKVNVGDDVQTDLLIREACRNILENVRSPCWSCDHLYLPVYLSHHQHERS